MNGITSKTNRHGSALLVVLFIVMAITVLSLGFLSGSDIELACGSNMVLKMQMDYLAESGLQHARGLILNPQDVNTTGFGYWTGAAGQQLTDGNDYYDVDIVQYDPCDGPTYRCNYNITSTAYRKKGSEEVGRSSLAAELRLDPCIAYWVGTGTTIASNITINGDVYCNGTLQGTGNIGGDGFTTGNITASIAGQKNEGVTETPVDWPGLAVSDFNESYYIGSDSYSVHIVDANTHPSGNFNSPVGGPGGVRYCNGDLELPGDVNINGTLVVNGTLTISGGNNTITAVKNFPALLVNGELVMEDGGKLEVNGLAQIQNGIVIDPNCSTIDMDVFGALFINYGAIEGAVPAAGSIDITAAPMKASVQTWDGAGGATNWSPAGGAFFKKIRRN